MRQSSFLKWAQSNKHKNGQKHWIHPPEALKSGHIVYLVKFLGNTEVESPKGIEVVKEGIRKLKFNQQLRRAEGGNSAAKIPKVEVTVSIDGVAIQEPKTKRIYHQYPLHRISYCADDKAEKRFFSFIAKEEDGSTHTCFVFVSDKLAEEITLTIGQAFDLAYRRFLETSGRELETKKQIMILQKKVQALERENHELQVRLSETEKLKDRAEVEKLKNKKNKSTSSLTNGSSHQNISANNHTYATIEATSRNGKSENAITIQPPPIPARVGLRQANGVQSQSKTLFDFSSEPEVGTKLENLVLNDLEDFNPRGNEMKDSSENNGTNGLTNGHSETHNNEDMDIFGAKPFSPSKDEPVEDPFKMGKFDVKDLENAIGVLDKRLIEMRDGFSQGLSFGNEDFSLESLDPLSAKAL